MDFQTNQFDVKWKHDVFLSFRGTDTRNNFTSHLYNALTHAGIRTFIDDEELEGGKHIKPELQKAIQESMMFIIVFSENYASSRWCLDELVMILIDCKQTRGQMVLPVFYDVEPSVVRHQTGSYEKAFQHFEANHLDMLKVNKWRAALKEAADISGHSLSNEDNGNESKFIQKIVRKVLPRVKNKYLILPDNLVGIGPHVTSINRLLNFNLDHDVLTLGIYGMGGIGKTTISKAVFNYNMHRFEGCSFVDNVKDEAKLPDGLVRLQEKLLSQLLNQNVKVNNIDHGINEIGRICSFKKVLILLDDVDNVKQLRLLGGSKSFFGPGSRIIMSTRDMHLLKQANVDQEYEMTGLNEEESMELFRLYAFRKTVNPSEDYMLLSNGITKYAGGLPLALEVIGSYLVEKSLDVWRSALEKWRQIPHGEIQEKLKVSFDALDDKAKDMFLDLACFFIGKDKYFTVSIWDACGFFAEDGIRNLIDKGLIKVDRRNRLTMHDNLRDMGREIIRNQSLNCPSISSRLWRREEVLDVITNLKVNHLQCHKWFKFLTLSGIASSSLNQATNAIEGISYVHDYQSKPLRLDAKIFEAMPMLRLLEIKNVDITGSFEHIFQELRWLSWRACKLSCLPSDFNPANVVILQMHFSDMKIVWRGSKHLPNLKILDLDFCMLLTETPDFTRVPNLESLSLRGCWDLEKLHPSIGRLYKLHHLDLRDCIRLKSSSILKCFDESPDSKRSYLFIHIYLGRRRKLRRGIPNVEFVYFGDETATSDVEFMYFGDETATREEDETDKRVAGFSGRPQSHFIFNKYDYTYFE